MGALRRGDGYIKSDTFDTCTRPGSSSESKCPDLELALDSDASFIDFSPSLEMVLRVSQIIFYLPKSLALS